MKAVMYYGPGDIRLEDRAKPQPRRDNLIVEVKCCAVCGTDLKLATIGNPRCHPPRIIGHEMVGNIIHVGVNVDGYSTAERITLATTVSCGNCPYCRLGRGNLCSQAMPISYDYDGAFAEYIEVPHQAIAGGNVIKIPVSVSDEAAALSEPLSCAVNAQELVEVSSSNSALIIGGGPLGAIHAALCRARGVRTVIVVGNSEPRLTLLKRLKDVKVIDGRTIDVKAYVLECTNGMGADVALVCAPLRGRHEEVLQYVRKGGAVSFFASLPKGSSDICLDSRLIHYGELRIVGSSDSRPEHVIEAVRLMETGEIDTEAIITHRLPIENIHEGLELMKNRLCLKVLIYPQGIMA